MNADHAADLRRFVSVSTHSLLIVPRNKLDPSRWNVNGKMVFNHGLSEVGQKPTLDRKSTCTLKAASIDDLEAQQHEVKTITVARGLDGSSVRMRQLIATGLGHRYRASLSRTRHRPPSKPFKSKLRLEAEHAVRLAQDNDVAHALTSDRSDQPFGKAILPR